MTGSRDQRVFEGLALKGYEPSTLPKRGGSAMTIAKVTLQA